MSAVPVRKPRPAPARKPRPGAGAAPARTPLRSVPGPTAPGRETPPQRRPKPVRPAAKPRPGGPATTPLGVRLVLLPVRLLLVPVRLAIVVLTRLTGGRPWLVLILALGCGVIALHAATLQTNQTIEARGQQINALERDTATLRNDVTELGATDRVSTFGREAGMVMPDPEGIGYLDARTVDPQRASEMITAPSPTWKPAPNASAQNGDLPATDGTGSTAGSVASGAAATTSGTDAPATGTDTAATTPPATGTTPSTTTPQSAGADPAATPPPASPTTQPQTQTQTQTGTATDGTAATGGGTSPSGG